MPVLRNLTGQRFGRLLVLGRSTKQGVRISWDCRCDCGNAAIIQGANLVNGVSRSCGCLQKQLASLRFGRHFMSRTATYANWQAMMRRCYEPSFKGYENYGARGIRVAEPWHSFDTFFEDMGAAPHGLTVERKDNEGPYSKENCTWASRSDQALNRRTNRLLTFNGETKAVILWARSLGFSADVLFGRLSRGWSTERALTQKVRGRDFGVPVA